MQPLEIPGYAKSKPASAHVEFVCQDADGAERLMRRLRFADLIFPRQWARGPGFIELPESQRIEVLLAELASYPVCGSLWLEVLDTMPAGGVDLLPQVRETAARGAGEGRAVAGGPGAAAPAADLPLWPEVFVGLAEPRNSALWPMGIPRLKFPARRRAVRR